MASVPAIDSRAAPPAGLEHAVVWRWVHVGIAALAMVLTLPGRTHGLGLFTEPLLKSLALDRESYGFMNLWATLLGALFCLPCGWLLDRFGVRIVLGAVTCCLGVTVLSMSRWLTGSWFIPVTLSLPESMGGGVLVVMLDLFLFLILTRGFGQSALSVVSLALIGRAAGRKSGLAMGVFAVTSSTGFLLAFGILASVIKRFPDDWRPAWAGIGVAVLILGILSSALVRNMLVGTGAESPSTSFSTETSFGFWQAMASPCFWTFTLAISFLGFVLAGTSLFGESVLADRGFDKVVFANLTYIGIPFGLVTNLLVGWLGTRWSLAKLMAFCTSVFALAVFSFPRITTETQVYVYTVTLAAAGGGMTVCFYSVYRRAFGLAKLGSIQGAAQMLTVLFSAVGPLVFASAKVRLGSYAPLFPIFAGIAMTLAVLTLLVGMPNRERGVLIAKLEV
jgi:MFS family permease